MDAYLSYLIRCKKRTISSTSLSDNSFSLMYTLQGYSEKIGQKAASGTSKNP
jgi:hypothetical protein